MWCRPLGRVSVLAVVLDHELLGRQTLHPHCLPDALDDLAGTLVAMLDRRFLNHDVPRVARVAVDRVVRVRELGE